MKEVNKKNVQSKGRIRLITERESHGAASHNSPLSEGVKMRTPTELTRLQKKAKEKNGCWATWPQNNQDVMKMKQ